MAARCDSEAANTLTLHLMHDIVTGTTTVDARPGIFGETMVANMLGRPAPYAEGCGSPCPTAGPRTRTSA